MTVVSFFFLFPFSVFFFFLFFLCLVLLGKQRKSWNLIAFSGLVLLMSTGLRIARVALPTRILPWLDTVIKEPS